MTPYTHWRVRFVRNSTYVQIGEITFFDSLNTDLTTGGTPIYSSQYDASTYAASQAFDKNDATEWCNLGTDTTPWLGYQHATAITPAVLRIHWSASSTYHPLRFTVEAGDGVTWNSIYFSGMVTPTTSGDSYMFLTDVPPSAATDGFSMRMSTVQAWAGADVPDGTGINPRLYLGPDVNFGGDGKIAGETLEFDYAGNLPAFRFMVRLYREVDGMLIAATWSTGPFGAYSFTNIDRNFKYSIIAYDHTGEYNAVIGSGITPDPM